MLKRKVWERLLSWKENTHSKALLIDGARQVGKTFIIRELGKTYASFVELNFLERPELTAIFSGNLDSNSIITGIRLYFPEFRIIPADTLIFIDEIQECPEAVTALKFLAADSRISIAASGSALGMAYKHTASYPVGSVTTVEMTSLDFEEFLWSLGVSADIIDELRKCFTERLQVPAAIHSRIMEYLRQYMVIGGMPEVVNAFSDNSDYHSADTIQRQIYRDYVADIARFASPDIKIKAEKCYKSIPLQLSKENHKFQYKIVEDKGTSRKFESSLDWLIKSHFVIPVSNVTKIEYPLKAFHVENNLRLYPNDIGLLICTYDFAIKRMILQNNPDEPSQHAVLKSAKGGLYEALAADMLYKNNHELYFYRNESGSLEIEFLIENEDGVVPVEVKAGRTNARSLSIILRNEDIRYGYKFSAQNTGVTDKKITMPLYMLMFL